MCPYYFPIFVSPRTYQNPKCKKHLLKLPAQEQQKLKEFIDEFQLLKDKSHPYYDARFDTVDIPTFAEVQLDTAKYRIIFNVIYLKLIEQKHPLVEKHIKIAGW